MNLSENLHLAFQTGLFKRLELFWDCDFKSPKFEKWFKDNNRDTVKTFLYFENDKYLFKAVAYNETQRGFSKDEIEFCSEIDDFLLTERGIQSLSRESKKIVTSIYKGYRKSKIEEHIQSCLEKGVDPCTIKLEI